MNKIIKEFIKNLLKFRVVARLFRKVLARGSSEGQILKIKRNLAVYDLGVNPVTFDINYFLYEASCFFRDYGIEKFELLIIANMKVRPWEQESGLINFLNTEKKQQRIYDLLLPIAHLYKECESVELVTDISTVDHILSKADVVYPHTYSIKYPKKMSYRTIFTHERNKVEFNGLSVVEDDIDKVKNWLQQNNVNRPFVTFTLRSYSFQESRNSDFALLKDFTSYLKTSGFLVVIVPDTDNIAPAAEFCESPIFFQGAFNIYQRAAIYELAFTNLFTSNGTHALSVLNKRSSFIFSKVLNEYHSVEHLKNKGFMYGSQPFAEERGIWLWENENIEVLIAAFEKISDWKKKKVSV